LNPKISKSNYNAVVTSWTDLHQNIGVYLADKDFNWNTNDSIISIVHKFYFKPNGEIKNYFYTILNASITDEKKSQFGDLIESYAMEHKIMITREGDFAQCGKTKYMNKP
jgi:hypothetical protein